MHGRDSDVSAENERKLGCCMVLYTREYDNICVLPLPDSLLAYYMHPNVPLDTFP